MSVIVFPLNLYPRWGIFDIINLNDTTKFSVDLIPLPNFQPPCCRALERADRRPVGAALGFVGAGGRRQRQRRRRREQGSRALAKGLGNLRALRVSLFKGVTQSFLNCVDKNEFLRLVS